MLSRACAVWFVLLIVLPFSAPFSTCDVATFLDNGDHSTDISTGGSPSSLGSVEHPVGFAARVPPCSRVAPRAHRAIAVGGTELAVIVDAKSRVTNSCAGSSFDGVLLHLPLRI